MYWGRLKKRDDGNGDTLTRSDGWGLAVIAVLVLGMVPNWLSPVANWRAPVTADIEPANTLWHSAHSSPLPVDVSQGCAKALQHDYAAGYPVGSRLLSWVVDEPPTHNPTLEGE